MSQLGFVIGPWWNGAGGALLQAPEEVPPGPEKNVVAHDVGAKTRRQAVIDPNPSIGTSYDGAVGAYGAPIPQDSNSTDIRGALSLAGRQLASTYSNYRRMRADGIVAIGRAMADALVILNKWSYEGEDPKLVEGIKKMWEDKGSLGSSNQGVSKREFLLAESCRAKDYGNHTLETVYGEDDEGRTVVAELLQLLPEHTRPLVVQGSRTFAGVRNWGMGGGPVDLGPEYCVRFVYDAEGGSLFGRSRFENCKEWVSLKWDARDKIRTDLNIAIGNIMKVGYPVDDSADETTRTANTAANEQTAATIGVSLARGLTVTYPMFSIKQQMALAQNGVDISKVKPWPIDRLDTGTNNFDGFKVAIDLMDEQILFGLLCLPRSIREADHGAKADAEQHTDSMGMMAWSWITYVAGTAQLVTDEVLEQWGAKRGAVQIVPAPLDDDMVQILKEILLQMLTPDMGLKMLDLKALCEKLGIKMVDGFDQAKLQRLAEAKNATDALSSAERLRSAGYKDDEISKIQREKAEQDAVPADPDGLGRR